MKQVFMSLETTEAPADVEDGERVELIRLGGPRDGARIGYATVRRLPDGELVLEVEPDDETSP